MSPKVIVISGPESSGKTAMVNYLSDRFQAYQILEKAREYLEFKGSDYQVDDVVAMAKLQYEAIFKVQENIQSCVISDTGLIDYIVWMEVKYGFVNPKLLEWFQDLKIDLYLLMYPDLPWEYDPLRENPNKRDFLFNTFLIVMKKYNLKFKVIKGIGAERFEEAERVVMDLMKEG